MSNRAKQDLSESGELAQVGQFTTQTETRYQHPASFRPRFKMSLFDDVRPSLGRAIRPVVHRPLGSDRLLLVQHASLYRSKAIERVVGVRPVRSDVFDPALGDRFKPRAHREQGERVEPTAALVGEPADPHALTIE